ncbi:gamma-glutamylcyclotransferase family protein [Microbacterium sp. P04]|uniref:gamma-glutamylcyclotransferase family protein n=1 Tax=Microbacterium sp. P04 TaxID=3366947 RepID=UPI003745854E
MAAALADQALFSYGTLQRAEVQLDTFGRLVSGESDVLPGFRLVDIEITDRRVVAVSGSAVHPVLHATGSDLDKVVGTVLTITEDELDAADEYELEHYRRVLLPLASGRDAWVYVSADGAGE